MQRRRVLFPEPERPKTTMTSPWLTSRSMPWSTTWFPNHFHSPVTASALFSAVPFMARGGHLAPATPAVPRT